jgi:hypothetical protein
MATPRYKCDHLSPVPEVLCGLPAWRAAWSAAPISSVAVRALGLLIGVLSVVWSPTEHAAGFSGRNPVAVLCLSGAMKLLRRRLPPIRLDAVSGGLGRDRPGTW